MKILIILAVFTLTSCCSIRLQDVNAWGKVENCKQTKGEIPYRSKVRISPDFVVTVYTYNPLIPGDSVIVHNILQIER